jgi:dicarboxylate/amino acid:cation (Na+ or H+) symporter, DAACS family
MREAGPRRGTPLHTKILLGLLLGATAGTIANQTLGSQNEALLWFVNNIAQPVGQVFMRMLYMVVVPLVFASLTLGVAGLGDLTKVGRVGLKTIAFFVFTTTLAALIGLVAVNLVRPGAAVDPATRTALLSTYAQQAAATKSVADTTGFGINTFVNIVPRNPLDAMVKGDMLGIIFFSLVLGIALTRLPALKAKPFLNALEGLGLAVTEIIGFAMKLAPIGVFGLIFSVTALFGFELLRSVALFVALVLGGLLFLQFGFIGALVKLMAGISPRSFFRRSRSVMITAVSTSSSSASLPTTLQTAEQDFGVPSEISGFVIPLGATMHKIGTALFGAMTIMFLAQVFGVQMSLGSQAVVLVMTVLTAIGAGGVPSGSIPLLVMVLEMVGIPGEGIALILGVDRVLDMARTVPNVTDDLVAAIVVAKSEGYDLLPPAISPQPAVAAREAVAAGN